jgi:hypothetical protein
MPAVTANPTERRAKAAATCAGAKARFAAWGSDPRYPARLRKPGRMTPRVQNH